MLMALHAALVTIIYDKFVSVENIRILELDFQLYATYAPL